MTSMDNKQQILHDYHVDGLGLCELPRRSLEP